MAQWKNGRLLAIFHASDHEFESQRERQCFSYVTHGKICLPKTNGDLITKPRSVVELRPL